MAGYILGRMFGVESYKDKTTALVLTAQESAYKALLVVTTFTAVLWMSIFLYASFYYSYMPAISHIRPVHLQYQSCGRSPGLCSFPSANVTLTQRQQLLMVGQPYKVVVELELPESPHNQATGMFLVCGKLKGADGYVVEESCRSAILHYKSFLHNIIATMLYTPFLLAGSAEEKQLVGVELFSGFTEHPDNPVTETYIEIQSQHVHIYQTYLKIHAHFTGLRYFMYHWPFLAASLGVSINFFFLTMIAFLSWYKLFVPKQTTLHVGYDANAARSVEEKRRILAREKSIKERDELFIMQKMEQEEEDQEQFIPKPKNRQKKVKDNSDARSKMEEDEQPTFPSSKPGYESPEFSKKKGDLPTRKKRERSSDEFEVLEDAKGVEDYSEEEVEAEDDKENREESCKEQKKKPPKSDDSSSGGGGVRKRKN